MESEPPYGHKKKVDRVQVANDKGRLGRDKNVHRGQIDYDKVLSGLQTPLGHSCNDRRVQIDCDKGLSGLRTPLGNDRSIHRGQIVYDKGL